MIRDTLNIISVGQCGNRIGEKFAAMGTSVCYINSDSVDMRGLNAAEDQTLLLDGRGTGGSTTQGHRMYKKHRSEIIGFLEKHINKEAINLMVFGCGGGTGGSIGPAILEYLISKKFRTGCLTVLPPKMLGILAGDNALRTLKSIKDLETNLFILADNEYLINRIGIGSNWWEKVNDYLVGGVASAFNLLSAGKISQSGIGSIDRGEVLRIVQYGRGLTDIRTIYLTVSDLKGEEKDLISKLFAPSFIEGFTYKNTLAYLVSIDVPQRGNYTHAAKSIFDATKKVAGSSISRLGMFVDPNLDDVIRITMINAGLNLPKILLSRINNLKRDEQRFVEKRSKEDSLDLSDIGDSENVFDEDFKL